MPRLPVVLGRNRSVHRIIYARAFGSTGKIDLLEDGVIRLNANRWFLHLAHLVQETYFTIPVLHAVVRSRCGTGYRNIFICHALIALFLEGKRVCAAVTYEEAELPMTVRIYIITAFKTETIAL